MGLDVALAIVLLIAAIRGWIQGFVSQAVKIAGLIACVYVADPLRDQVMPYVGPYVQSIPKDLVDRLLWWACAAASYVVIVGVSTLLIKMTQRPEIPGIPSSSGRNDQFGGFLIGAVKGTLSVAFLVAGIQKYALDQVKAVPWADEQVNTSVALKWSDDYQPVAKIWSSGPVQHFVNHVRVMGLQSPDQDGLTPGSKSAIQQPPVQTASRGGGVRDGQRRVSEPTPVPSPPEPPAVAPSQAEPRVDPAIEESRASLKSPVKPSN